MIERKGAHALEKDREADRKLDRWREKEVDRNYRAVELINRRRQKTLIILTNTLMKRSSVYRWKPQALVSYMGHPY